MRACERLAIATLLAALACSLPLDASGSVVTLPCTSACVRVYDESPCRATEGVIAL